MVEIANMFIRDFELDALFSICVCFVSCGLTMGCACLNFPEEPMLICEVPNEVNPSSIIVNSSLTKVAFKVSKDGKEALTINGNMLQEFDEIGFMFGPVFGAQRKNVFSPDGERIAFACRIGSKWYMYLDGIISESFDEVTTTYRCTRFSSNSKRFVFMGRQGSKWFVVVDLKKEEPFDRIPATFIFSNDCSRYAYVGVRNNEYFAVIDGKSYGPYDKVYNIQFSPSSAKFGYQCVRNSSTMIVVDGRRYESTHRPAEEGELYLDDKNVIFVAESGERQYIVQNNQAGPQVDEIYWISVCPHGDRISYLAEENSKKWIFLDGKKIEANDFAMPTQFSSDCKNFFYIRSMDMPDLSTKEFLIWNGEKLQEYDSLYWYSLSPDGQRVASLGLIGPFYCAYVDEQRSPLAGWVTAPVFSPDSKHTAYAYGSPEGCTVMVDRRVAGTFGLVYNLRFSNDGSSIILVEYKDGKIWRRKINASLDMEK